MDNDKLNKIQDLLEDEEFKVDNFEFKLWLVRKSWADSLFFDFKVYNPNDEPFCRQCLESSLYQELKPYLRYFNINENITINIYDKDRVLEPYYITDDFVDGLFDSIKDITDIDYDDNTDYDDLKIKIKQKPLKISVEIIHDNTIKLTVFAKYISHEIIFDGKIEDTSPLNIGNHWDDFVSALHIDESWYHESINNYLEKHPSMECMGVYLNSKFI